MGKVNSPMIEILHAGRARAAVDPAEGGRLVSLSIDGNELLGSERPKPDEPSGWFHGSFPMAPYVGRVEGGTFSFEGRDYSLPTNAGNDAGHGVVFDVPWEIGSRHSPTELTIETHFDARWPFGGYAQQIFSLNDSSLKMTLIVRNEQRRMPVMLGFHPWFRRDIGTGPGNYTLQPGLRYQGSIDARGGAFTADLGTRPWDDVLTQFALPPQISWPEGPTLTLTSSSDFWVVFEQLETAFCIEPISDAPGALGTVGAMTVEPGEQVEIWMNIDWDSQAEPECASPILDDQRSRPAEWWGFSTPCGSVVLA
jgi:aldose 1-epimerase